MGKKTRITILSLHLSYGGIERFVTSLSNSLISKYEIKIISVYNICGEPAFKIDERIECEYLLGKLAPNTRELKRALKSKNIFKIFKEGFLSAKILYLKKSRMKKAIKNIDRGVVISTREIHNELLGKYGKGKVLKIATEHNHHNGDTKYIDKLMKSCRKMNYLILPSKELASFYDIKKRDYSLNTLKCLKIAHQVEVDGVKSTLNGKKIVSIGRLSSEKGYLELIDIFKNIEKKRSGWKLTIVGDGEERETIKEKILKYNLQDKTELCGFKSSEEIAKILLESSIYIMTSIKESFGIVLIEAQGKALPIVAYDSARGASEIVKNGESGFLIRDRNASEMVEAVIKLIDDLELRVKMGENGYLNALNYSSEIISKEWYDIIEKGMEDIKNG